jgi:hypothetical protein
MRGYKMKEQVGVDDSDFEELRVYLAESGLSIYDRFNEIMSDYKRLETENKAMRNLFKYIRHSKNNLPIDVEIDADEILRLKRLDENVKYQIYRFHNGCYEMSNREEIIKLLESLDK